MDFSQWIRFLTAGTFLVGTLVLAGCSEDERLANAALLLDLGKSEEAVSILDAVIADNPEDAKAHVMRGRAFAISGDLAQANEAFTTAISFGGEDAVDSIDEELVDAYTSYFIDHFPFEGDGDSKRYSDICRALQLLNSKDSKNELADWQAEQSINQAWDDRSLELLQRLSRGCLDLGNRYTENLMKSVVLRAVESADSEEEARDILTGSPEHFKDPAVRREIQALLDTYKTDTDFGFDTMALIRNLGRAIEGYAVDWSLYPTTSDASEMATLVSPTYVKSVSTTDGWQKDLFVNSQSRAYVIVSPGADGRFEADYSDLDLETVDWVRGIGTVVYEEGFTRRGPNESLDSDIIYINGTFYRWPDGFEDGR